MKNLGFMKNHSGDNEIVEIDFVYETIESEL